MNEGHYYSVSSVKLNKKLIGTLFTHYLRLLSTFCSYFSNFLFRFVFFFLFYPGYNPVFDETFEFHINLPDLALVRFVVQDDDFIGDGFIGQYTIPLNCIQPGNSTSSGVYNMRKYPIPFIREGPLYARDNLQNRSQFERFLTEVEKLTLTHRALSFSIWCRK